MQGGPQKGRCGNRRVHPGWRYVIKLVPRQPHMQSRLGAPKVMLRRQKRETLASLAAVEMKSASQRAMLVTQHALQGA